MTALCLTRPVSISWTHYNNWTRTATTYLPEASSIMRALSGARCTDVRLYTLWMKIGTNQRALGEHSHYWTRLRIYSSINSNTRGEFNNASARRALVDWYLSLFITCKTGHQYNERPRALALLNLPPDWHLHRKYCLQCDASPTYT